MSVLYLFVQVVLVYPDIQRDFIRQSGMVVGTTSVARPKKMIPAQIRNTVDELAVEAQAR